MAVVETFLATWSGGSTYARVEAYEAARNDAAGYVDIYWWNGWRDTHPSVSGTWDWSRYGQAPNASGSVSAAPGTIGIASGYSRVYCDANGNYSDYGLGEHMDVYYGNGDAVVHVDPARSPLAPGISSLTADTILPTGARLGIEISNFGHGTSAAMYTQYRKQGDSTWIAQAAQNDVAGYNYFSISGLTPGTTYEYMAVAYNNNGDTSSTGTQTFKTLPAPNASTQLFRIIGLS